MFFKKFSCLSYFLIFGALFAKAEASGQSRHFDNARSSFLIAADTVSLQTGDFILQKEDLLIRGKEPISIKRFYQSSCKRQKEGGWCFLPQCKAELVKIKFKDKLSQKLQPGEIKAFKGADYLLLLTLDDGTFSILGGVLHKDTEKVEFLSPAVKRPLAAFGKEISAKNHFHNLTAEADLGYRSLTIQMPDGRKKFYTSNPKTFDNFKHKIFLLDREERPNKTKTLYSWDKSDRLSEIKTLSPSAKHTYAWARFYYNGQQDSKNNFLIKTSDGRSVQYHFTRIQRKKDSTESHYLTAVSSTFSPTEYYEYQSLHNKRGPALESIRLPMGKILQVQYFTAEKVKNYNLVRSLKLPDSAGNMQTAYSFFYQMEKDGDKNTKIIKTVQSDKEGNYVYYFFKMNGLLDRIEYFINVANRYRPSLKKHSSQKLFFDENGQLISKCLFDSENRPLMLKHFSYDANGNVSKEAVYGDLTGKNAKVRINAKGMPLNDPETAYCKYYKYSNDAFNLRVEEAEDNGLGTEYRYLPNTNLLTCKLIKDAKENKILIRYFFEYDRENVLIRKICDDGRSRDKNSLENVTQRHIKHFLLSQDPQSLHLPAAVEEKYLDLKEGREKLLKKTAFTYSDQGLLSKEEIFDEKGKSRCYQEYSYSSKQLLTAAKDAQGLFTHYAYDKNFNLQQIKKENVLKTFKYDQLNRLVRKTTLVDQKMQKDVGYKYDYKNNLVEKCSGRQRTEYAYDAFGNCTRTVYPTVLNEHKVPVRPMVKTSYDLMGNIAAITNGCGETVKTLYTAYKKPKMIEEADGKITGHTYYKDGRLKKTFLPGGGKEFFQYDVLGNLICKQEFFSNGELKSEENWRYKGKKLISRTEKTGLHTDYEYDFAGRKIKETQNQKKVTTYRYDSMGFEKSRCCYLSPLQALLDIYEKDRLGRILEERKENLNGEIFFKKSYGYNSAGDLQKTVCYHKSKKYQDFFYYDHKKRLIKHSNPLGNTRFFDYQNAAQNTELQKIYTDSENNTAIETYDALSRLSSLEKQNSLGETFFKTNYYYDAAGRQTLREEQIFLQGRHLFDKIMQKRFQNSCEPMEITLAKNSPAEKIYSIERSNAGRCRTFKNPSGAVLFYNYDEKGNLTELKSADGTIHLSYSYDAADRLVQACDLKQDIKIKRKYDEFGNLIEEKIGRFKIKKEYDLFGRPVRLNLPDGSFICYKYDECRLLHIERYNSKQEKTFGFSYLEFDQSLNPIKAEIENLTPIHYKTDPLNRRFFISSRFFQQEIEQFSPLGNILSCRTHAFQPSFYSYDFMGQITEEKGIFNNSYLFDSGHNLLRKNGCGFALSAASEITGSFLYDQDGQPISDKKQGAVYKYDALGRLIFWENSSLKISYSYDPLHRRFSKTVVAKDEHSSLQDAKSTYHFLNSEDQEIGAVYTDGSMKDLKITEPARQGSNAQTVLAIEIENKTYPVITDLRGNIAAILDTENKSLIESCLYSAFGEQKLFSSRREETNRSLIGNPYTFQGMRKEENGLLFFVRRFYSPELARFLTPDPLGLPESSNPYAYACNSPLNNTDTSGLVAEPAVFYNNLNNLLTHRPKHLSLPRKINAGFKRFFNFLSTPFKLAGAGLELASEQLPLPIVQDAMYVGGRLLQLKFSPMSLPSLNSFQPAIIKYGGFNSKSDLLYINGILNDSHEIEHSGRLLFDIMQNKGQLVLFHNPSKGLFRDLMECIFLSCGFQTTASASLSIFLKEYLNDMDSDGRLLLMAHSGGALNAKAALQNLTEQERQMIEIRTFSPASPIAEGYGRSVVNYLSQKDLAGTLAGAFTFSRFDFTPVKKLKGRGSACFIDHPFSSSSYQEAVRKEVHSFF